MRNAEGSGVVLGRALLGAASVLALVSIISAPRFASAMFLVPTVNLTVVAQTDSGDDTFHFDVRLYQGGGQPVDSNSFDIQTLNGSGLYRGSQILC